MLCSLCVCNDAYSSTCCNIATVRKTNKKKTFDQDKWQTETIRTFLKENGYKEPSQQSFHDKCLYLFGIDLPANPKNTARPINSIDTEYTINELGRYIYPDVENLFYQPWIDRDITKEDARKYLYDNEAGVGKRIAAYNKLLFNNDSTALPYFKEYLGDATEAVFLFDYEGNPDLMEIAVKNARLSGYFDVPSISAILFYNNKKRGIRKRLIKQIYDQCANNRDDFKDFERIVTAFSSVFDALEYDVNTKDQCLVYLVTLMMDYDNNNRAAIIEPRGSKAFEYLEYFLRQFPDIESRLKKHNFYDNNKLKELVASIRSVQQTEAANGRNNKVATHFIYDSDGFCNMREKGSISARIIGRIPSDTPVRVLEADGEWWKVSTNNGKIGYVHKSRIIRGN
jgi:hypothetical protein